MCKFCNQKNMARLAVGGNSSAWVICNPSPIHPILGHFLIVPKKHYIRLDELSLAESMDLFFLELDFMKKIEERLKPAGLNLQINQGKVAGQTVMHLQIHILCREPGDGIVNYHWEGDRPEISEAALERFKYLLK